MVWYGMVWYGMDKFRAARHAILPPGDSLPPSLPSLPCSTLHRLPNPNPEIILATLLPGIPNPKIIAETAKVDQISFPVLEYVVV